MIKRTFDKELVFNTVMKMIDDVTEDNTPTHCFVLDVDSDCWLEYTDGDNFIGLFQLSPFNRTVLDMHCYLLKEYRNKSHEYSANALKWVKDNSPEMYSKVITQTPFRHISIFLKRLGFEVEGCYKKSFTKNGEKLDLELFGLDRDSI